MVRWLRNMFTVALSTVVLNLCIATPRLMPWRG